MIGSGPWSLVRAARGRTVIALVSGLAVVGIGGCASSGASDQASTERSGSRANVITAEQLEDVGRVSVYDAVRRLRPAWLRNRGYDSFQQTSTVKVYLDGQSYGSVADLRNMQTTNVATIQWLDGIAATQRFGMDHGAGVIMVIRTDGPPRS